MTLDLSKLFGVKERQYFKIKTGGKLLEYADYENSYFFIENNKLMIKVNGHSLISLLQFSTIDWNDFEIITCEKKILFAHSDLLILKSIYSSGLRYITKDLEEIWIFEDKPRLVQAGRLCYWNVENSNNTTTRIDGNILSKILKVDIPDLTCIDLHNYIEEFNKI